MFLRRAINPVGDVVGEDRLDLAINSQLHNPSGIRNGRRSLL